MGLRDLHGPHVGLVYSTAIGRSDSWYSRRRAYWPLCLSCLMSKVSGVSAPSAAGLRSSSWWKTATQHATSYGQPTSLGEPSSCRQYHQCVQHHTQTPVHQIEEVLNVEVDAMQKGLQAADGDLEAVCPAHLLLRLLLLLEFARQAVGCEVALRTEGCHASAACCCDGLAPLSVMQVTS